MQPSRISSFVPVLILLVASVHAGPQSTASSSRIAQARAQLSRGQLEVAEKTLWTVLAANTNQPDALTLLGIIRGRQKRYAEAEALLRHVLEIDPKSVVARENLANAFIAEDKQDAAIEQYEAIVRLSPRDYVAKIELAQLYVAKGEFSSAVTLLDQVPPADLPPEAIPVKAASLLGVGKQAEAAALISSANGSPRIGADLAQVFLDANAPELANRTIAGAFAHSPHPSARLYYLRGSVQQAQGQTDAALKSFNEALARDPNSINAILAVAAINAFQNKHQEALVLLKRAYALQAGSPEVLRPFVVEAAKAGETKAAARVAHALALASPANLDDLYLAAAAMLENQEYTSASDIFERYVAERPRDAKGFLGLGIAESAQGHYDAARKALERALQINPDQGDVEYQLGVIADHVGASLEAMQHFQRTIQLQPNHAKALASLGAEHLQAGELQEAHDLLQRAVAADPNDAKAEYNLALTLAKLGKTEEAKQHMERSRTLEAAEQLRQSSSSKANTP